MATRGTSDVFLATLETLPQSLSGLNRLHKLVPGPASRNNENTSKGPLTADRAVIWRVSSDRQDGSN